MVRPLNWGLIVIENNDITTSLIYLFIFHRHYLGL